MKTARTLVTTLPKPEKPWADFPLYWHPRGYWMCRRWGRELRYTRDALQSYELYKRDMEAHRQGEPLAIKSKYRLADAINYYLTRQKRRLEDGELGAVQFAKCRFELQQQLPLAIAVSTPLSDFTADYPADPRPGELFAKIRSRALKRGLSAAHRHITLVRAMLEYAAARKMMRSPDYGDDFHPPSKDRMDRQRHERDAKHGDRTWTLDELRVLLAAIKDRNVHLYAQCLLALFAGFGSDDCSALPKGALRPRDGVVKFPRVKNGRPRVAALPKVVWDALAASQSKRAKPASKSAADLVFLTSNGTKCNAAKQISDEIGLLKSGRNDTIGVNFRRMLRRTGLERYRAGFKSLRSCCRTILLGANVDADIVAVIMGRPFRFPVDEYYIRGNLRQELVAAAKHIESKLFQTN